MNYIAELESKVQSGHFTNIFSSLYPAAEAAKQPERTLSLLQNFSSLYGEPQHPLHVLSAPGRTEVGGNHTDHQHGRVLAAAVNLDAICIAAKTDDNKIRIQSVGYAEDSINITDLAPRAKEQNKAISLIRGICARMQEQGYHIGGFNAYTTSDVPSGSGLSSSAAFENLIATTLNFLFNDGKIDAVTIAQIGQYAENTYFGKPSGLLDQATSSVGGFITIDFADPVKPMVEEVDFDFSQSGHTLCIVATGGDHADLTDEYAGVSGEMDAVAHALGKAKLREVESSTFYESIPALRTTLGDRPLLRAIHFFGDNQRVPQQVAALRSGDFDQFKKMVIDSGRSSFCYLQNVFASKAPQHQGLSLALALSERLLAPLGGAWRVHGGGFAGTIQAYVPNHAVALYQSTMDQIFGAGACQSLSVRPVGAVSYTDPRF